MAISNLQPATEAVRAALDGGVVVVTAGAGLGVDSGLPDFRGPEGFWNAYPPYRHLGLHFADLANPRWFTSDPPLAWGFYGHRLGLYRRTAPHAGYDVLRALLARAPRGGFVFTSNVDGAFAKAGVDDDRVCEVHGSIHFLQCSAQEHGIWAADGVDVDVDEATFRAREPLPRCRCGAVARPNIVMFGDGHFDDARYGEQVDRLQAFVDGINDTVDGGVPVVVVEAGAGTGIPTVRAFGEGLLRRFPQARLVRINAREAFADDVRVKDRVVAVSAGARDALVALARGLTLPL